ncbi:MAG TPA: hypothetical protein VMG58_12150 [Candidatus Sulfotelmatobacter sp.]|nr:hypothetical protein [Candidatus Sulfotelmatobacter sp.]
MWLGLIIMLAMIAGLVWWFVWAMRRDAGVDAESQGSDAAVPVQERKAG